MTNIARDFAWVLIQVLDGVKEYELTEQFAIPEDECAKVMNLLAQARAFLDQVEPEEPTKPPVVTLSALLCPAYEPGDGSADGAQLVGAQWWHPEMGCDSLQIVVDNARAVLTRWGRVDVNPPAKLAHNTTQH